MSFAPVCLSVSLMADGGGREKVRGKAVIERPLRLKHSTDD